MPRRSASSKANAHGNHNDRAPIMITEWPLALVMTLHPNYWGDNPNTDAMELVFPFTVTISENIKLSQ